MDPTGAPPNSTAAISIGTRELRQSLAAVVRQAGDGQRFVVTVDGRPVAELGPIGGRGPSDLDGLIATGLLEPPRRSDRPPAPDPTPLPAGMTSDRLLTELRGR